MNHGVKLIIVPLLLVLVLVVSAPAIPSADAKQNLQTANLYKLVNTIRNADSDYVSAVAIIPGSLPRPIVESLYTKLSQYKFKYYALEMSIVASNLIKRNGEYVVRLFGPRDLLSNALVNVGLPVKTGLVKPMANTMSIKDISKVVDGEEHPLTTPVEPNDYFIRAIIGADVVNSYGITGSRVTVAVVDTGIDYAHPFLQAKLVYWTGTYYDLFNNPVQIREPLVLDADESHVSILYPYVASAGIITVNSTHPVITPSRVNVPSPRTTYNVSLVSSASGVYRFGLTYLSLVGASAPVIRGILLADPTTPYLYTSLYIDFNNNGIFGDTGDIVANYYGNRILAYPSLSSPTYSLGVAGGFFHDIGWWLSNGRILPGWDLNGNYISIFYDFHMHGTACASAVAGIDTRYGGLMTGIAPGAKVIGVKALWAGNTEIGQLWAAGFDIDLHGFIYYTGSKRADIISNSWGISSFVYDIAGFGVDYSSQLATALTIPGFLDPNYPGIIVVQAAGNGGGGYGTVTAPGAAPGVITVGASTSFFPYVLLYRYGDAGWDQIISWAARGPTPLGYLKPDVVLVGMGGFTAYPVGWGRGTAYTVFSGTSYATPLTAGSLSLILDALIAKNGESARNTDPALIKHLLMNTADYLGYPPFDQGAGRVNVLRAVDQILNPGSELLIYSTSYYSNIATKIKQIWQWYWSDYMIYNIYYFYGNIIFPTSPELPSSWAAKPYYGVYVPDIPRGMTKTFYYTIYNPTSTPVKVEMTPVRFSKLAEVQYTLTHSLLSGTENSTYIILDKSNIPAGAEIMQIEVNMPFKYFDGDLDYQDDYELLLYAYFWVKDTDGNGYPYNPAAANRPIQVGELAYINYGLHSSNYNRLQIAKPLYWLQMFEDYYGMAKLVIRVRFWRGLDTSPATQQLINTPVNVTITYYKLEPDPAIRLGYSVFTVQADSTVTLPGLIKTAFTDAPSAYQSYIRVVAGDREYYLPVTYTVTVPVNGESTLFLNGIEDTNVPYSPSHIRGENDWGWRYEAGDWRVFYVRVTDPNIISLEVRALWQYENTSLVTYTIGPDGQFAGIYLGESVSWHRHIGSGIFIWHGTGGLYAGKAAVTFPSTRYRDGLYPTMKPNTGVYTIVVRTALFDGSVNLERFKLYVRGIRAPSPLPNTVQPPSGSAVLTVKFPYTVVEASAVAGLAGLPIFVTYPSRTVSVSGYYSGNYPPGSFFTFNLTWSGNEAFRADIAVLIYLNVPQLPVVSRIGSSIYVNTTTYFVEDWVITGSQNFDWMD